jgi:F-type H+-transporting ATPase subunit b
VFLLALTWQVGILPLSAAEAVDAESAVNPLMFDPDLAIFTALVFVLLLLFLTKFAWRPLMDGLEKRERSIADMIAEAKRGNEEAAKKLQAYEGKLAEAAVDAQQIVNQARKEAEAAGEKMLTEARAQAQQERERAVDEITAAKNAAVKEIADQSADIAFTLARKLIRRELKPEDHGALIRETLDQFPSQN